MIRKISSQKGGISILVVLMIPVCVMILTLLIIGSENILNEYMIDRTLKRQNDLILSQFDDVVYDRFGLFGYRLTDDKREEFRISLNGAVNVSDYKASVCKELTGEVLYDAISRFSKVRFPVHATAGLIDWISKFTDEEDKLTDLAGDHYRRENDGLEDNKGSDGNGPGCGYVYDLISMIVTDDALDKIREKCWEGDLTSDDLKDMIDRINESGDILPVEEGYRINGGDIRKIISSAADKFKAFQISDPGEIYKRISFEYYTSEMFTCSTDMDLGKDGSDCRKNMRGIGFEKITAQNQYETETIIFGCEDPLRNKNFAQTVICSTRFIIHIASCLLDPVKSEQIKTAAASICSVIALASCGSVPVPPEVIEGVLIVISASCETLNDWDMLSDGEKIVFIPAEGFEKLQISYRDHLRLMLLCIPADVKLERIASILRDLVNDVNDRLYTGVCVSCDYKGKVFSSASGYYG